MSAAHQQDLFAATAAPAPARAAPRKPEPPAHHTEAMRQPLPGFEHAVVLMFRGLTEYADAHAKRYGGRVADDHVLGESWHWLGEALIGLLNGETGRLDCGTLDGQIRDLIDRGGAAEAVTEARELVAAPVPERRAKSKGEPIKIGMAALTERQRELLSLVRVEGNFAVYTGTERIPDWELLKRIMLALGGEWSRQTKKRPGGFAFPDDRDAAELVRLALETGEVFDPRAADFFPTPDELADLVIERADIRPGLSILEPSAGRGALVRAVLRAQQDIPLFQCVEALDDNIAGQLARIVHGGHPEAMPMRGSFNVVHGDFLLIAPGSPGFEPFDRVVMNPPFGKRADIEHVRHAYKFLAPGGTLVSIMSAGVKFRDDRLAREFRELVAANGGEIWDNPDGSFKESGTGVRTVMVRVRRAA